MPVTHVLSNTHGNRWFLTAFSSGKVLDSVRASCQPTAAMQVEHLLPSEGEWEQREGNQYWFRTRDGGFPDVDASAPRDGHEASIPSSHPPGLAPRRAKSH